MMKTNKVTLKTLRKLKPTGKGVGGFLLGAFFSCVCLVVVFVLFFCWGLLGFLRQGGGGFVLKIRFLDAFVVDLVSPKNDLLTQLRWTPEQSCLVSLTRHKHTDA